MKAVIVTRHQGLLRWLEAHHPELMAGAEVLPHITAAEQIRGKVVVGNIPMALAAEAALVMAPTYEVPAELRGQELTAEQLEQLGCHLEAFQVVKHKIEEVIKW
jgi:CRISPR-associated protein Csx16